MMFRNANLKASGCRESRMSPTPSQRTPNSLLAASSQAELPFSAELVPSVASPSGGHDSPTPELTRIVEVLCPRLETNEDDGSEQKSDMENTSGASKKRNTFINKWITKLDKEIHVPGYQFCGPGTKVLERIKRGERGINLLDNACMQHDLYYEMYKDLTRRHEADRILSRKAWKRVKASDAKVGERFVALCVTVTMDIKIKLGL